MAKQKKKDTIETVGEYNFRHEAEQACELLRNQEIDCIVWSDDGGGIYPTVGFIERYLVRVFSRDLEGAREILGAFGLEGLQADTGRD
ncbi:hypothetical protein SAMN05920897_11459 [Alkalispirochaeta americana]|uniref:Signal transducing protein n=1 Tax=Alkalispirochaeta americana TaxID=159291 RepID=A0A1N6VC13_9SPIO|nr:hypothetical protein [Alkalispirochaeta americana]SIQ75401.1 hypothetical protein SAMN05920897_11459 [Alkalispirochaeta americana]